MKDYRLVENRREYFKSLYNLNLVFRIHPGMVYTYMPELSRELGWDVETELWFAAINGHTQNPITSLKMLEFMPSIPQSESEWTLAAVKFNEDWTTLSFDADRLKQKKDTMKGLRSYAALVQEAGSQSALWDPSLPFETHWVNANRIKSFGRLSSFSFLEYVRINKHGTDCSSLFFDDLSGSRSHRNGMFFLLGRDHFVFDKRQPDSHDGKYPNLKGIAMDLEDSAEEFLKEFQDEWGYNKDVSKFTFESCLCQFKNGFFSRRYPGVYADMGWQRIEWYDKRGLDKYTSIFKDIRAKNLPEWLREECEKERIGHQAKADMFAQTGRPYRAEYLLEKA